MLDRERAIAQNRRGRGAARMLFDMVAPEAYYKRPIALRHPVFLRGPPARLQLQHPVKKGLAVKYRSAPRGDLCARIDPHESSGSP
jgi:hypothetical protein